MRFIRNMILNCILISLSSLRTYKWRPDQAKENRSIYGMNAELNKKVKSNDWDALFQLGVGFALMLLLIRTIIP
jgi:hypothetical protein